MLFASSGFGPTPSRGATVAPTGSHDDAAQNPLTRSVHTSNGFATVAMRPNQNTAIPPMTASARTPNPSPTLRRRHTNQVNTESINPQSTTLPESAAHPAASRKTNGVASAVFLAT